MFWDDIQLVTEQVQKYGLQGPFADLGGLEEPCIADYVLTTLSGDQQARYVTLQHRPFDHLDPTYAVINPENGDPFIEDLPSRYRNSFGTAVCLNVLEHVQNPFETFRALYEIICEGGLLVLETVFSFPYHPSPNDFWRFTPASLRHLGESVGFTVLECDWRLTVCADQGIQSGDGPEPREVRSVYITLAKGDLQRGPAPAFALPRRQSTHSVARHLIALEDTHRGQAPLEALNDLATTLFHAGHLEAAKLLLTRFLHRYPRHCEALTNLAVVQWELGEQQEALNSARKAFQLAPADRDAGLNLAALLQSLGQESAAQAVLQTLRSSHPTDSELAQLAEG